MQIYNIPVVPAQGGAGSCLKDIYKTFLIYRTCMRRAPAKPVRACTLRKWCLVSHVTFEAPLHTSQLTVFTLHSPHFTLHSSHCALRSQHFTSHCTLKTPHFTLHTSHCTLHALSHCTLHTPNFTLHTSHCALHAPHFTLHSSHPTLHLV